MVLLWVLVFIISLIVLVKGADWLLGSAEKIGLAAGLSPFIIGVTIVGIGTSFPEMISSLLATFRGAGELVAANAVGSNIANILLIIGISAIVGRKLIVTKSLIDLDLPLLAISTGLVWFVLSDRVVEWPEALLLVLAYGVYFGYTLFFKDDSPDDSQTNVLPGRDTRRHQHSMTSQVTAKKVKRPRLQVSDFGWLALGLVGLYFGAQYMIESVVQLSVLWGIGADAITLFAVAVGTSLPELLVSVKAAMNNKSEVAIGNILGSNVFNLLGVIAVPAFFATLPVDEKTYTIGLPVMIIATVFFVISGISRRIHIWEGAMYVIFYVLFILKLFGIL
ncbi:MAG: calcium/sodium antiporter [Candidatus Komeilibacteria bacterium]|nr:calcium/sodium antiporter [Candidatus Komeilibacteria bacterium]